MIFALVLIANIVYATLEGFREAYYYFVNERKNPQPIKKDLHPYYSAQRIILWLACACIFYLEYGIMASIFYTLGLMALFPLIHDGVYYMTYHKLEPSVYPKGFWDESTTSTAKFEFSKKERILLAVIGVMLFFMPDIVSLAIKIIF